MVVSQEPLGGKGTAVPLTFEWEGHVAAFSCELRWTHLQSVGTGMRKQIRYHCGCRILESTAETAVILRAIVADHVARALDEQKANARGIPPTAVHAVQTGVAREFVRHELTSAGWRQAATLQKAQPRDGFTVAADLTDEEVEMLRAAYASGDAAMRSVIRKTAELSIANAAGIPARRYSP